MAPGAQLSREQQLLASLHYEWAEALATRFARRHRRYREEIHSAALYGLTKAALQFDPDSGIEFQTYARHRIVGHIKDALIKEVAKGFRDDPGSAPHFTGLGLDYDLEEAGRVMGCTPDPGPGAELEQREFFEKLVLEVPWRFRPLFRLLYVQDLTLRDAARMLGISPSLATSWHTAGLARLGSTQKRRFPFRYRLRVRA